MMGLQLDCCTAARGKWFSRKNERRESWSTTVEVPESSLASQRRCSLADDDKYMDEEVLIDRRGLRKIRFGSRKEASQKQGGLAVDEDDCLSVASTQVGDDHSDAGSVRCASTKGNGKEGFGTDATKGSKRKVLFENIRKIAVVGRGSSGVVWRCVDKSNCHALALKQVLVDDDEEKTKMAVRELVTMYGVDHAGVVTCHEVFYSRGSFQMVLEYMDGGSLLDAMRRDASREGGGSLTPNALAVIGRSVASALEMLHDVLEVVHRDVKPGNILLCSSGLVKLADLGICTPPGTVHVAKGEDHAGEQTEGETPATEWIGTLTYMSPERLVSDPYSFKADVWSLGIVLVEAAIGRYPLAPPDSTTKLAFWDLLDRVLDGPCPSTALAQRGPAWQKLAIVAKACLDTDPVQRPRAKDLKECEVLMAGDAKELAGWVRRNLADKVLREEPEAPQHILREADMWA